MINIAPYWVRAQHGDFHGIGWSFTSEEEAREHAKKKAAQHAEWFILGTLGEHSDWYYGDRPMCEPILREFLNSDGIVDALVTRNSYGCAVLNTTGACFVDVDFPYQRPARRSIIEWLLGMPKPVPVTEESMEADVLARVDDWQKSHPNWSWRIYRTKAGMRLLATHATFEPHSQEVADVCHALGADALYLTLCKSQKCFRARLTPKSWRCGLQSSEVRWPCRDHDEVAKMQKWNEAYQPICERYATCRYLTYRGTSDVLPELAPLIEFHDATALAHSPLPLA